MNRMKRLLAAALTFAATLSLASCGTSNSKDSVGQTPAPPSQNGGIAVCWTGVEYGALSRSRWLGSASAQQLPVHFRLPISIRYASSGQYRWFSEGRAGPEVGGIGGWSDTDVSLAADVRFHNGDICDAQAVVASFQRLKEEESPRAADYANYTFSVQGCGYCGSNL